MNKQEKFKAGRLVGRGIQWTDYTWNPIAGCQHACRWRMPDGHIARCYAEDVADKFKGPYPQGFAHHYWHPQRLEEPLGISEPAKIFLDSMADLMGHWVPDEQINAVLDVCRRTPRHSYQLLTKNAPRLADFRFPSNVWVGASSPPDFMWGKPLTRDQQARMLDKTLKILSQVQVPVRWLSVEPLSWDISEIVFGNARLDWAVIGAASNGRQLYQPEPGNVERLLAVFDKQRTPVFFKGNLWGNPAANRWREYFPYYAPSRYMGQPLGPHALPVEGETIQQLAMVF